MSERPKVLLTGGTGRLGRHVLGQLLAEGCAVRVATPDEPSHRELVEWYPADFLASCDFQKMAQGCDAVIHLAAELNDMQTMERVNGDATQLLAEAAETNGVKVFIYTSSVCVYGMPKQYLITETTPTISVERGCHGDVSAPDYLKEYGRTKLLGERAIISARKNVDYIVLRPSNISDNMAILAPLTWSATTKIWRAHRYTHQIHTTDVVAAISFMLWRHLKTAHGIADVTTYNLSDDMEEGNRFVDLFREAARRSGKSSVAPLVRVPGWLDWQKDRIKFRKLSIGFPPGIVRYMSTKLLNDGFVHPLGIVAARARALDSLSMQ